MNKFYEVGKGVCCCQEMGQCPVCAYACVSAQVSNQVAARGDFIVAL